MQAQINDERAQWKALIQDRHIWAVEWATEILEGQQFIESAHHRVICQTLDKVIHGDIKRLIINLPPGYSKTLTAVWAFIARGFVVNQQSRFIHTSYSAELALDNSSKVKELLLSDPFQDINPLTLRDDTKAKGLWRTGAGGGMRSVQTGGGITGFRAGNMDTNGFAGAIVVDDPLKPDDARSRKMTADQNKRYNNTIASRLAHENVPIIVIMQRIASFPGEFNDQESLAECGDLCEYLLAGGSGEKWSHLELPVEIDRTLEYPKKWTHGIPIEHDIPDGPLWEFKHTAEDIARLKRADKYTYAAQYAQRPKKRTGSTIIDGRWFQRYEELPFFEKIEIYADTANKTGEQNDYTVFLVAGVVNNNLYVLDLLRKKFEIPDLYPAGRDFWNKWKAKGASKFNVEDKQSGTYLIQSMQRDIKFTVNAIQRNTDKFTRVNGVVERISSGHVFLPLDAPWVAELIEEVESFTDDDSHAYDDITDCLVDAIETLIHTTPHVTGSEIASGLY